MTLEVEAIDTPLDYNIIIGCIRNYLMNLVVSLIFQVVYFPRKGMIVANIDQLSFSINASI